ncbi:MAG: glycosyltransferase family 4 protein [Haloarcula sp.]
MIDVVAVTGPADGRSGIGDYVEDLTGKMTGSAVETVTLPMGSNDPTKFAGCAVRIGSRDTDVIHIQHEYGMFGTVAAMSWVFFPVLYVLAALRGTPVVITIHEGLNEDLAVPPLKWLKGLYLNALNRMIVLNVARVVFLSQNTANEFTASVPIRTYTVLPHGAEDERLLDIEQDAAKRRLGYDPDETLITGPGYVEPRKGSDRFIELADRMDEYEFLLAGGPAKQAYEEYFERIEDRSPQNLTLTGFLDKERFHTAFIASDLVVLSYQNTQQGGIVNTVNQSGVFNRCATYGTPVVASDLPYFRAIEREWDCLRTCEFDDTDAAEGLIRELLSDEEELDRLSTRIREYAESRSFTEVAKRHEGIYRSVASVRGEAQTNRASPPTD